MTGTYKESHVVELSYHSGIDLPADGVFVRRPVDPDYTDEIILGVYDDESESFGFPAALTGMRLQIELAGSRRALDSFGTYLIALAKLQSEDPDLHEHFDDVTDARGGTVHLVVRLRNTMDAP
jgi:hypothetical protein